MGIFCTYSMFIVKLYQIYYAIGCVIKCNYLDLSVTKLWLYSSWLD